MADDAIIFTVNDQRYELAKIDTFTFAELRIAKRLSGISQVDFTAAVLNLDADAWFALLFVSMRRRRGDVSEAELEQANFVEVMNPLAAEMFSATSGETGGGDHGPPPAAGEAREAAPAPAEMIPEESGVL